MMIGGKPCCIHFCVWVTAVLITHSPMARISPLFSAMGMNSEGEITPNSG